jgi:hypothetical protein
MEQTTQTFSCLGHLRICGTNNINILMSLAFENTQNEQHKHSHAVGIGEYITIDCKDAPSLLITQPHAPCSYTLPTLHNIVKITHLIYNILGWSSFPSICPYIHPRQRGGGGRGPFLNCKTPLFQGIAHSALFIAQ